MSLLDQIAERMDGQMYEGYFAAVCIFHKDHTPSLIIHSDTYKCLACGAFGSTKGLLKRLSGLEILAQPIREDPERPPLSNPFHRWLKRQPLGKVLKSAHETLVDFPHLGTYLMNERSIDAKTIKSLGIGWKDGYYVFPVFDPANARGRRVVSGFVRCPPGAPRRYYVPKGHDPNLLYIPAPAQVQDQRAIFLTFGAIDSISLMQMGYASMSTTDGKQVDPTALDAYRKPIIILPDAEEEPDAYRLAKNLGWRGHVFALCYPEGCKDVNDFYRKDQDDLRRNIDEILRRVLWR